MDCAGSGLLASPKNSLGIATWVFQSAMLLPKVAELPLSYTAVAKRTGSATEDRSLVKRSPEIFRGMLRTF
jgi:hypothetical protein